MIWHGITPTKYQGCHYFHVVNIEVNWGDSRRNYKIFGGDLSKPCTKFENWGDFTDVMSSNITVYSRRKTILTVSKKWTLTIWTRIIYTWTKLYPINICKCTGLTILCNKHPVFSIYLMIQCQLPDTENKKKQENIRHQYDLLKLIILLSGYWKLT